MDVCEHLIAARGEAKRPTVESSVLNGAKGGR